MTIAIDHEQLKNELETKFVNRFNDQDEDYAKSVRLRNVEQPCIYPWFNHQNRGRGGYNNNHNNNQRNQYNNQRHHQQNSYQNQQRYRSNEGYQEQERSDYKKRRYD